MTSQTVRVGTRATALAKAQTEEVLAVLREKFPDRTFEVVEHTTAGDAAPDLPVAEIGEAGCLRERPREARAAGQRDRRGRPQREGPPDRDHRGAGDRCLHRPRGRRGRARRQGRGEVVWRDLPDGAKIGTSSPRRHAMLKEANRSFEIVPVRGSVDTRLGLLDSGEVDALVLAVAGLKRLGLEDRISAVLDEEEFMPAPGQGVPRGPGAQRASTPTCARRSTTRTRGARSSASATSSSTSAAAARRRWARARGSASASRS